MILVAALGGGGLQFSLLNFPSVPVIIDLPNERIFFSAGGHYFS